MAAIRPQDHHPWPALPLKDQASGTRAHVHNGFTGAQGVTPGRQTLTADPVALRRFPMVSGAGRWRDGQTPLLGVHSPSQTWTRVAPSLPRNQRSLPKEQTPFLAMEEKNMGRLRFELRTNRLKAVWNSLRSLAVQWGARTSSSKSSSRPMLHRFSTGQKLLPETSARQG